MPQPPRMVKGPKPPRTRPTARELQVVRLTRDGVEAPEIARRLGITINTVESHRRNLLAVLGCSNSVQVVMHCLRKGYINLWDEDEQGKVQHG